MTGAAKGGAKGALPDALREESLQRRRRARLLSLLSTLLALSIAFVLLLAHQFVVGRRVLLEELRAEAAIIAANSSAALVFDDARAGQETVAAIRHTPRILAAALYRADGRLLALHAESAATFPGQLPAEVPAPRLLGFFPADPETLREPVLHETAQVGTLVLRVDFSSLYWRLAEFALGMSGIAAVALALSHRLTGRLRRRIARTEEQLERFALYDQVTGLPNRRLFERELRRMSAAHRPGGPQGALLFLDIDDFKKVNDAHGHAVGDQVLAMIGGRLRAAVRGSDIMARIGGDEFAVILTEVGSPDNAANVALKLIEVLGEPFPTEPVPSHIGVSIGIAMLPDDGDSPGALLRNADMAMYVAKGQGKNSYHFFSSALDGKVRHDLALESGLRRALGAGGEGLWVAYQPKLCARTQRVLGVEALARWRMADGQTVSPAEFIPVAEHSGLIVPLGEWLLDAVCRDIATLRAGGLAMPPVAVNVSALQLLRDPEIVGNFCRTLAGHGEPAEAFEIELTESALTEARGAAVLEGFRAAGFALAIDDFGTGYSSLGYLRRFQVGTLKIDQSFVRRLPGHEGDAAIVRAVIQMAEALNIAVVAEGVETRAQADFLAANGCAILQGYLFARPMDAAALAGFLRAHAGAAA